ncbi:MAG: hypothetical protein D9C04_06205 [Nitrosopumilus sp. B06]|nr:MAG: hypothetical protein D9C04_06205 [Nitrosopumilus sp. B06]
MRPISKGVIVGSITVIVYLLVVVLTTPALDPLAAVSAAVQLNYIIIAGMGVGIGLHMTVSEKSKLLGCGLERKKMLGGNSGAAATSFFSFFSLVPLGCCGWWLYVLSLLPGILGTGASAVLVQYSQTLAYAGLLIVFGFAGFGVYRLRRAQKIQIT